MAESEPTNPKPRPIIRIGLLLISHSLLVSVVCCTSGVVALLFLPVLAKNTYFSENALMPGSASPMLSHEDVSRASRFVNNILSFNSGSASTGIGIPRIIEQHIKYIGGEVNFHKFQPQENKFHPLHFFSSPDPEIVQENYTCSAYGINTIGIIRAPHGDGKESIVLVTPYNSLKVTAGEALSLGIGYSVFSLLTRVTWLAKDIIWIASDSQFGDYASVASWLRDYHSPSFGVPHKLHSKMCYERSVVESDTNTVIEKEASDGFRRAGTMAAALVIKVADASERVERDSLYVYAEASNGQMPNLDLINVVNYLAVHAQGFRVKVAKVGSLLDSWWLKSVGRLLETLGKVARTLNSQWNFAIPVTEYVEGAATLASSLYNQALGIPTGPHGAFRDVQVDSITVEVCPKLSSYKLHQNEFLFQGGRLVEGVVRSVNNLLEKFHHSYFLYLLTSPNKFVSVGVYMVAFALLISPLPLVAASLFIDSGKLDSIVEEKTKLVSLPSANDNTPSTYKSWKWIKAANMVIIVHVWGATVALLPQLLSIIPVSSIPNKLLVWAVLSLLSLLILHAVNGSSLSFRRETEWALLKSVTIAAAFIGLCLMSVINFATAEIGALTLVPMCLMARPLGNFQVPNRPLVLKGMTKTLKPCVRAACSVLLLFLGFPPIAFFVFKGAFQGFNQLVVSDLWNWVESLWVWSSATYIYICMVHLPCWVLCMHVTLLHQF